MCPLVAQQDLQHASDYTLLRRAEQAAKGKRSFRSCVPGPLVLSYRAYKEYTGPDGRRQRLPARPEAGKPQEEGIIYG